MIAPYTVGKTVKVYFNPNNPIEAVLKKNDSLFGSFIFVVVTMIFLIAGFALINQK